jgi:ketosteroid isomerase-like protein
MRPSALSRSTRPTLRLDHWLRARCWVKRWVREKDAGAAAELFTDDATYLDDPFGELHTGTDGVRAYWEGVTATQEQIDDVRAARSSAPTVATLRSRSG